MTRVDPVVIGVQLLHPEARAPARMSEQAAGFDLHACLPDRGSLCLEPGRWLAVPTGVAIALPSGFEGQVRPRSGLARNYGVTVLNAPGTIDSDYRGELIVLLINHGAAPHRIENGDRIAQLVVAPVARALLEVREVQADETERGGAGFGSTGR